MTNKILYCYQAKPVCGAVGSNSFDKKSCASLIKQRFKIIAVFWRTHVHSDKCFPREPHAQYFLQAQLNVYKAARSQPTSTPFHKLSGSQDFTRYPITWEGYERSNHHTLLFNPALLTSCSLRHQGEEGIDPPLINEGLQNHNCLHAQLPRYKTIIDILQDQFVERLSQVALHTESCASLMAQNMIAKVFHVIHWMC